MGYTVDDIGVLLTRSADLEVELLGLLDAAYPDTDQRISSARTMCCVTFEHGQSAKALVAIGNFTSANGLVRLQYEALVRAIWLTYAASNEWVVKLGAELTAENAQRADKLPLLKEMLDALEGKGPDVPMSMLKEFKEYSWKPLSSFVHGGIHAMHRHGKGYPMQLLDQAVRASNGLAVMAAMLWIVLSKNPMLEGVIPTIQREFADCLPPPRPTVV